MNMGQIWYGPQQELEVLKRFLPAYKPKVVILVFYGGNDLSDFRRYEQAHRNWEELAPTFHSFYKRSFTRNSVKKLKRLMTRPNAKYDPHIGTCPLHDEASASNIQIYFHYKEEGPLNDRDLKTLEKTIDVF